MNAPAFVPFFMQEVPGVSQCIWSVRCLHGCGVKLILCKARLRGGLPGCFLARESRCHQLPYQRRTGRQVRRILPRFRRAADDQDKFTPGGVSLEISQGGG